MAFPFSFPLFVAGVNAHWNNRPTTVDCVVTRVSLHHPYRFGPCLAARANAAAAQDPDPSVVADHVFRDYLPRTQGVNQAGVLCPGLKSKCENG